MANHMKRKSRRLGVAVVGLGIGEQHARAYAKDRRCEVRWLHDTDAGKAKTVRRRLNKGSVAGTYRQVLADDGVDVVSIASYDDAHFGQVRAAFAAGKHVFVEKPLCRSRGELKTLVAAWKKAKKPHLMSNLVLRAAPVYGWLKRQIDAGRLGDIYAFDGDYLYGRLSKITEGWRKDVTDYSAMEGGGVHLIDLMLWLAGERPTRVTTLGNRIAAKGTGFRYDDFMASTFEFPSGLIGRVTANFGSVHRHHHVVRVFGTKATFIYDDRGPRIHRSRDEAKRATAVNRAPLPAHKGVLIPGFVGGILAGRDSAPAARREFDLISVTAAADDSHRKKRPVAIGYLT
jgi:predicted dehydrogenase